MLQRRVIHCSCFHAVDESVAVQFSGGVWALEQQLRECGALEAGESLEERYPEVAQAVRTLWSNLGNITSDQICGVGSLCSPAVKHRGGIGLLARALNIYFLLERWFHSTFLDARKQDAIDLVTLALGAPPEADAPREDLPSTAQPSRPAVLGRRQNNYSTLEMGAVLTLWGLVHLCSQIYMVFDHGHRPDWTTLFLAVVVPLCAGLVMLWSVLQEGRTYLEQPQLYAELLAPGWKLIKGQLSNG